MTKPFEEWTVLPHGQLVQLDENLLEVTGVIHMPMADFARRMTVVRLFDGSLVIYSAIALDEVEMRALEAYGRPAYLVVPNDAHRLDAKIWKDRYPTMRVIAPAGAREKVEEVVPVDDTAIDFGDPRVQFVTVPGTGDTEGALVVDSPKGTSLVLNDIVFNVGDKPGVGGWLLKLMGMTGDEPRVPPLVKLRSVKDKHALAAQLEDWSHLPALRRVIVSHGKIIDHDASAILERVAGELAA